MAKRSKSNNIIIITQAALAAAKRYPQTAEDINARLQGGFCILHENGVVEYRDLPKRVFVVVGEKGIERIRDLCGHRIFRPIFGKIAGLDITFAEHRAGLDFNTKVLEMLASFDLKQGSLFMISPFFVFFAAAIGFALIIKTVLALKSWALGGDPTFWHNDLRIFGPELFDQLVSSDREAVILLNLVQASETGKKGLVNIFPNNIFYSFGEENKRHFRKRYGRTMYYKISEPRNPDGAYFPILRLKGIRPRRTLFGSPAPYHGGGLNALHEIEQENGRTYLITRKEPKEPQGTMSVEAMLTEYNTTKALPADLVDKPLAAVPYAKKYKGKTMGFVIFGMASEDFRLGGGYVDTPLFMQNMITGDIVPLSAEGPRIFAYIGRALRRVHKLGYIHRMLHLGNIGIEELGMGSEINLDLKIKIRDWETAIKIGPGADKQAIAGWRFVDVARPLFSLRMWLDANNNTAWRDMIDSFMHGYFNDLDENLIYGAIRDCYKHDFVEKFTEADLHYGSRGRVDLAAEFPDLWRALDWAVVMDRSDAPL